MRLQKTHHFLLPKHLLIPQTLVWCKKHSINHQIIDYFFCFSWGVWNTSAGQLAERQLATKQGRCVPPAANLHQLDSSSKGTTASLGLRTYFSTISIFTELLTFLANMSKSPDRTVITLKQYVRGKNGWDFLLLHFSDLNGEEGAGMCFHLPFSN